MPHTEGLKINSPMPDFRLLGTDNINYTAAHFDDKKILVVIFSCNHCPYAVAYEDRINQLQEKYAAQSVQVIAINSNDDINYPEDSFENMVERAQNKNFIFPYLRDQSQSAARAFNAGKTPHVFIFNQERKLAYTGCIDDNWQDAKSVKDHTLDNAISSILADKSIKNPSTYAIGCTIKWKE